MPTGHFRFRRSLGNVSSNFRGARPDTYPRFTGLLDTYGGAAAAYSLRALSSGWLAGDVVEVRRSSDSTSDTFTAGQITGGQMLDFVNGKTTDLYNSARYFNGTSTKVAVAAPITEYPYTMEATIVTTASNVIACFLGDSTTTSDLSRIGVDSNGKAVARSVRAADGGSAISTTSVNDGQIHTIKGVFESATSRKIYVDGVLEGTDTTSITPINIDSFAVGLTNDSTPALYFDGVITDVTLSNGSPVLNYTGLGTSVTAWEDTIGSNDGTETNGAAYTGQPFDAFVSTWYDQSGNANDATQATTTAQPKIVAAGALVTGGLDFDGVDDVLSTTGQVLTTSTFFMTGVMQHDTGSIGANGETVMGQYEISTSGRFQLSANASNEYSFFANATDPIVGFGTGAIGTSQTLISTNGDGSNAEIWRDGTSKATDTYSGFAPAILDFTIGDGQKEFDGKIAEVIVYNSSQSANRAGIETNIQAAYPALP